MAKQNVARSLKLILEGIVIYLIVRPLRRLWSLPLMAGFFAQLRGAERRGRLHVDDDSDGARPGNRGAARGESDIAGSGDRVRLITETLAWRAEIALRGRIGEIIERREDGRITIRFDNGRLLMAREPESFELVSSLGLRAKGK